MQNRNTNRKSADAAKRTAYLRGKLLEKRRALLENMVSGFTAAQETSGHIPSDLADIANAAITNETTCEIGSVESNAVTEIDHALEKLDKGTYGICEECQRRIPEERLRVLPFASLCVECKARIEREEQAEATEPLNWLDLEEADVEPDLEAETVVEGAGKANRVREYIRGKRPT